MFCERCQSEVVECLCPDIEERLRQLAEHPAAAPAALQNLTARLERLQKEKKGVACLTSCRGTSRAT